MTLDTTPAYDFNDDDDHLIFSESKYLNDPNFVYCPKLNLNLVLSGRPFEKMVDQIFKDFNFQDIATGGRSAACSDRDLLAILFSNVHQAIRSNPLLWVSYSRNNNSYKVSSRYNTLSVGERMIIVIDHAINAGLLRHVPGFYESPNHRYNRLSRVRPSASLNDYINDLLLVPAPIKTPKGQETIILKDNNKNPIEYDDTKNTIKARKNLNRLNKFMAKVVVSFADGTNSVMVTDSKPNSKYFGVTREVFINENKIVKRTFNRSDWDKGGRFYGGAWQSLPSGIRANILLNGEATIEIDYSALHITILAVREGVTLKSDPYSLPRIDPEMTPKEQRKMLKLIILVAINADSVLGTCKAMCGKYKAFFPAHIPSKGRHAFVKSFLDLFIQAHPWMKKYLCADVGVSLQNDDSKLADFVLGFCVKNKIPVLCVHDSFIVPVSKQHALEQVMYDATVQAFGISFNVK